MGTCCKNYFPGSAAVFTAAPAVLTARGFLERKYIFWIKC